MMREVGGNSLLPNFIVEGHPPSRVDCHIRWKRKPFQTTGIVMPQGMCWTLSRMSSGMLGRNIPGKLC